MALHKNQGEEEEMVNLASIFWEALFQYVVVCTQTLCLAEVDKVAALTNKLKQKHSICWKEVS